MRRLAVIGFCCKHLWTHERNKIIFWIGMPLSIIIIPIILGLLYSSIYGLIYPGEKIIGVNSAAMNSTEADKVFDMNNNIILINLITYWIIGLFGSILLGFVGIIIGFIMVPIMVPIIVASLRLKEYCSNLYNMSDMNLEGYDNNITE